MAQQTFSSGVIHTRWVWLAWSAIALAWGPAAALVSSANPGGLDLAIATAWCLASFLPWAVATPLIFRLCALFPIGQGHDAVSIVIICCFGAIAVPILTLFVPILQFTFSLIFPAMMGASQSLADVTRRTIITSLFAVPSYVAVIAVGQTILWANRARNQQGAASRAQLRALRAELSPHFVSNVLGSIAQVAHISAARAENALAALAAVLRSGLAQPCEMHTLTDELGALDEHLALYRALFGSLVFDRQIADNSWHIALPSRILVPLIENALTHGNLDEQGQRSIRLTTEFVDDAIRIKICNPWVQTDRRSLGLGSGIDHVRQRLRLVYGQRAKLTIDDSGGLFRVTVDLPFG
ncbi:histidine kinase [Microcoleus sp. F10-B2]